MKKKSLFAVFIVTMCFTFIACHPKNELIFNDKTLKNIPDSVLNADTMVSVMVDIHLAEALVQGKKNDSTSVDKRLQEYYGEVMAIHHIDEHEFKSSYAYYVTQPVIMNYIYRKITDKLNLLESQYKPNTPQTK